MLGILRLSTACLIAAIALTSVLRADPPSLGPASLGPVPQEGFLLLRNGRVIQGTISRVGEVYHVAWPHGEIQIKTGAVEFCCRDLDEGYRSKRAIIQQGDIRDHLQLAQWCLRQGLLGYAGRELSEAMAAEPRHPMIGVLERRLRLATRPSHSVKPSKPSPQRKTNEDLNNLVRGMPAGTVETFTRTVQPLLANYCGTAQCHGPGTQSEFKLLRIPVGKPSSRRMTQRNLRTTLKFVDRETPDASRLLSVPIRPHGAAERAVFTDRQIDQYRRIVNWVHQVAKTPANDTPATVSRSQTLPVYASTAGTPAASRLAADPFGAPAEPAPRELADPFDPEIFNRRFFPE